MTVSLFVQTLLLLLFNVYLYLFQNILNLGSHIMNDLHNMELKGRFPNFIKAFLSDRKF